MSLIDYFKSLNANTRKMINEFFVLMAQKWDQGYWSKSITLIQKKNYNYEHKYLQDLKIY